MTTSISVSKETLFELTQRERLLSYLLKRKLTHDDTILELCKICDNKYKIKR